MTAQGRTRSPRGQGDLLRGELVSAARDLLTTPRDESPFSLRAVARAVGVSPAAVYRHFPSATELVTAVVDDHNELLRAAVGTPSGPVTVDALAAFGAAYVHWGLANPGAYQLLFESADRFEHPVGPGTPGWSLVEDVARWLAPAVADDAATATIRAWTALHGLTSLRLHKPALPWPSTVEAETRAIARAALSG